MSAARPLRRRSRPLRGDGGRCGGMPCGMPPGRRGLRMETQADMAHSAILKSEGAT
jgi:hypothetical protein